MTRHLLDSMPSLSLCHDEVRLRIASGRGVGSLNTTFDFASGGESGSGMPLLERAVGDRPSSPEIVRGRARLGVPLLDGYWERLDDASYVVGEGVARLNPRLYLIWKTSGYCTPYHQDVHVPPHFTLYNQTSGACPAPPASAFHSPDTS